MLRGTQFTLSWLALLLAAPAQSGGSLAFHADLHEAQWTADGSVFECSMRQVIPGLGEAVFYHQAGEPLNFYLESPDSPMRSGRALLTSLPPDWRNEMAVRDIGYVDVTADHRPVRLDESRSRLLLSELRRGMMPTVIRRAAWTDEQAVQVGISPVNLTGAVRQYHQCVGELLPVNFSQIERSTIFWDANQTSLDAEARRLLDDIATYSAADQGVYSFQINGFTDSLGTPRQNLDLSRTRAFAVHDYLVQQGVDEDMLSTRYFGSVAEYRIVPDERSAADRDRNRRVTIRIQRRGPRQ
ncbi:MAG: flagellar protein MotY [Pseudomonadota bacterium]